MADIHQGQTALGDVAARTLANATKTVPMLSTITPRWLVHLLQWVPLNRNISLGIIYPLIYPNNMQLVVKLKHPINAMVAVVQVYFV